MLARRRYGKIYIVSSVLAWPRGYDQGGFSGQGKNNIYISRGVGPGEVQGKFLNLYPPIPLARLLLCFFPPFSL
jgi:hypothetical protein